MNHLYLTNYNIDENGFALDIAKFLLDLANSTPNRKFSWEDFALMRQNTTQKTQNEIETYINTGKIINLPTQSKQDLSQNLIPLFLKYDSPIFLIIGSLSEISTQMQQGLLRFIEEPPQNLNIILTSKSKSQVLETIISRCQLKTLPNKISIQYIDKIKNDELVKHLPNPKEFIQSLLKNQVSFTPDFKNISREGWDTWLWQLEYLTSEAIFKNSSNTHLNAIFQNIIRAKKLNQANVLNRLVWASLFS